ncbi:MAG: RidA family protein [Mucilaginibacter sp.]|uniref:RidA family protein n=1 Tax=Mucilaginibacter sp. TaxID=1882438 RepID=UPI0032670F55
MQIITRLKFISCVALAVASLLGCQPTEKREKPSDIPNPSAGKSLTTEQTEYFHLRPEVESNFMYSHAVRTGNDIMISGAVSIDDKGVLVAKGDLLQQMKNVYADLDKILKHYGCTFENVVVENIFTTDMPGFVKHAAYRKNIYGTKYPSGSWLEVKGLALPGLLIEIELRAHKPSTL